MAATTMSAQHNGAARRFAIVTGASSGIGYELAKCCARDGFDLLVATGTLDLLQKVGRDMRSRGAGRILRPTSRARATTR